MDTTIKGVEIEWGLRDGRNRERVVDLLIDAFGPKLMHLELMCDDTETLRTLLRRSINTDMGVYALDDGDVVGFAALDYGPARRFFDVRLRPLIETFGFWGGLMRWSARALFGIENNGRRSALRVEMIAVAQAARGRGVGTSLLTAVREHARDLALHRVTLEVVDTNPRARRLYEQVGYRVIKRTRYGGLTRAGGFTAVDFMEQSVSDPHSGGNADESDD